MDRGFGIKGNEIMEVIYGIISVVPDDEGLKISSEMIAEGIEGGEKNESL